MTEDNSNFGCAMIDDVATNPALVGLLADKSSTDEKASFFRLFNSVEPVERHCILSLYPNLPWSKELIGEHKDN
jgi:hypothetical protein